MERLRRGRRRARDAWREDSRGQLAVSSWQLAGGRKRGGSVCQLPTANCQLISAEETSWVNRCIDADSLA